MTNPRDRILPFTKPRRLILPVLLSLLLSIFLGSRVVLAQSDRPSSLIVTPSSLVLLEGEDYVLSAVDATGHPVPTPEWTISLPVADLQVANGEAHLLARTPGRAILSATLDGHSASASISVLAGQALPPATVRWSLQPTPGFETLLVMQAVPTVDSDVAFYSIEWSRSSTALIRALRVTGQQLWMTYLSSSASPQTLKQEAVRDGQTFLNGELLTTVRRILIGDKGGFAEMGPPDVNSPGLPLDGKSILLRGSGDNSGGLVLLERGRFRDSLVDLSASDGHESWRYRSSGRLNKNWTVNYSGDIAIVETLLKPVSAALLVLNGKTGEVRFRIPFPVSSSAIDGFKCIDSNVLENLRPSPAGSVFTSNDGNMYVQIETHVESLLVENCKHTHYSFDNSLSLLRVSSTGETEWKTFQHIHADGNRGFVAQPRVFAGESIPDGFGGVLAAWTYSFPGAAGSEKPYFEARLSRIGPSRQRDFSLPMPSWTKGIDTLFDRNMVLGDGNVLYATNGQHLLRFDTQAGELSWVRQPPTGEVKLQHATAGGGILVANAGRFHYFDAKGTGADIAWTVPTTVLEDVGLAQSDLFDQTPAPPLLLRDAQLCWAQDFIAVEDGAPNGHGTLIFFTTK